MTTHIVDLSALFWRNWHASDGDEFSSARRKTIGFIRSISGEVIVAIDSPPYKRSETYPDYKKNRSDRNEAAVEELWKCIEEIRADGKTVASAPNMEADDVIFTLLKTFPGATVWATDKDLLQCCQITEPWSKKEKWAEETLGVKTNQVVDYLALVGDASDNIIGVRGIGPKTARAMLQKYHHIDDIYKAMIDEPGEFKPTTVANLDDAKDRIWKNVELIQLYDCSDTIKIEKRQAEEVDIMEESFIDVECAESEPVKKDQNTKIVKHVELDKVSFERSLEPSSLEEAWRVSAALHESRFFGRKFANQNAVLSIVLAGRELGLGAFASVNGIDNIQGTLQLKASVIIGLIQRNPYCEYFYCEDSSTESCTWITKRKNNPKEQSCMLTMDELVRMGVTEAFDKKTQSVKTKDNYLKQPDTMLQWRCGTKLARRVYGDIIHGLYAFEEME